MDALEYPEDDPALNDLEEAAISAEIEEISIANIDPMPVSSLTTTKQMTSSDRVIERDSTAVTTERSPTTVMPILPTVPHTDQTTPPVSTATSANTEFIIMITGILVAVMALVVAAASLFCYLFIIRRRSKRPNRTSMMIFRGDKYYPSEIQTNPPVVGEWFFTPNGNAQNGYQERYRMTQVDQPLKPKSSPRPQRLLNTGISQASWPSPYFGENRRRAILNKAVTKEEMFTPNPPNVGRVVVWPTPETSRRPHQR